MGESNLRKNSIILGVYNILVGLLLIVGPRSIFEVCPRTEKIMKCWWSVQAELGMGIVIICIGILYILFSKYETKIAMGLILIVVLVVSFLIPRTLIGGCMDLTMRCQTVTFPWIYGICAVSVIVNLVNVIYLKRVGGKNNA